MRSSRLKRILWLVTILTLLAGSRAFYQKQRALFRYSTKLPLEARVETVIDGDTIILGNGEKVRYLGLNAPEIRVWNGYHWITKPQILGEEAKSFNLRLVEGKRVILEYDQKKRDDYNRLLAYVRVGAILVNGELVRNGFALMDVRAPNLKYQNYFLVLQKEARDFKRGIWGKIEDYKTSDQKAFISIGAIGVVQGKIIGVHLGRRKAYLNFGKDWKKDFTVIIYKENLRNFPFEKKDLVSYFLGRRVKIYGFIKDINGPAIVICAPSQLDILDEP